MPTTPGSPFLQSVFSGPAPAPAPISPIKDPHDLMGNTYIYGKEFVRKYFLLWYWASYTALRGFGFEFDVTLFAALVCMLIGCATYGIVKAREESRKAKNLPPGVKWQPPSFGASRVAWQQPPAVTAPPPAQQFSLSFTPQVSSSAPASVTPAVSDPFVGNIVLGIYHVENCDWVDHISTKNRVGFATALEATSHGFKPCRICSPPTS
jgi:hypothetical protein